MPRWTLDDGLKVIRLLQPETRRFGYHLTLGGGVLNKGQSDKDLDLCFLPLDNIHTQSKPDELLAYLKVLWGEYEDLRNQRSGYPYGRRVENSVYKYKVKFMMGGEDRIDVFIL